MQSYILSLAAGVLVGAIYALMNVRSPAPPVIALAGLLGILIGEHAVPLAKRLIRAQTSEANAVSTVSEHFSTSLRDRPNQSDRDS